MRPHAQLLKRWREDPVAFVTECLKVQELDDWQVEGLRAFPHKNRIALKAAKGPGKTAFDSMVSWNFLATRPYPKIAATSISGDNLADGLWAEMSKWQERSDFLKNAFVWNKTRIESREAPENWFMSARSWSKSANPAQQANTLAGIHADYTMFVLDESGGIPDSVMAAAEAALATGIECKLVQSGNPTHLEGPLYRACTSERHLWYVIEVTGDPDDPKRAKRISIQWAKEQIEKYGRDNPWTLVNVFGKFPPSSINSILGPDEVNESMRRKIELTSYDWSQKRLGVDVARFGDDRTVLFPRQGLLAFNPVELRKVRTTDIAARVMLAQEKWKAELILIDDTGHWGHGVIDNLISAGHSPMGIQFHAPALDNRYKNRRAEMWLKMAEWVRRGGGLPNIPELVGELTTPTYTFSNGKFQLEDKDQVKERLGRSPDLADGLALTFAVPDLPGMGTPQFQQIRGNHQSEWDPYTERI